MYQRKTDLCTIFKLKHANTSKYKIKLHTNHAQIVHLITFFLSNLIKNTVYNLHKITL